MKNDRADVDPEVSKRNFAVTIHPGSVEGLLLEKVCDELRELLTDLHNAPSEITFGSFTEMLSHVMRSVYPVFIFDISGDHELVAYGELHVMVTAEGKCGHIENVIVKNTHRGRGLGQKVMLEIFRWIDHIQLHDIYLTSAPHRKEAHALYKKLGFIRKKTNVFELSV